MRATPRMPAATPATAIVLGAIIAGGAGSDTAKAPSLSTICETVDERMAATMKVGTATSERIEKRERPHRPCPEVQPLPSVVPMPSTAPHMSLVCGRMEEGEKKCEGARRSVLSCGRARARARGARCMRHRSSANGARTV